MVVVVREQVLPWLILEVLDDGYTNFSTMTTIYKRSSFDIEQFNQYLQTQASLNSGINRALVTIWKPMLRGILEPLHRQQMESQLFSKMCV